jgi:hypothetical protein
MLRKGIAAIHRTPLFVGTKGTEIGERRSGNGAVLHETALESSEGMKYRLTIDYRALNKVIHRTIYLLPHIDDLLASLDGAKSFSVIDTESAFYQIRLESAND